ncbi:cyclic nucleotide-binding domain-containing protein [Streptomyces piniterrae]|uniref:Cyclic nucleotide-binding domain-containing protein n=1 Tax=Streptomyces piniterrae TaxID=2571125 RepID=A0A4U0NW74_9ACTN|nr:cyclic nucleotide-binding domain-containing protein [Streptomyces piniterrae]TJZ58969.1 cyclic nucleotide-binding domain-containing protein [Streptomyces piniterrae]
MTMTRGLLETLPPEGRARLDGIGREVSMPRGARVFEEGRPADRFWVIRSGRVALDQHVPGRRAAVVETVGRGDLLGWSWLFPPYLWHLGAETESRVEALEFDAAVVRSLCMSDPVLGREMYRYVAETVIDRLHRTRIRLLDLYGPQGSGLER